MKGVAAPYAADDVVVETEESGPEYTRDDNDDAD